MTHLAHPLPPEVDLGEMLYGRHRERYARRARGSAIVYVSEGCRISGTRVSQMQYCKCCYDSVPFGKQCVTSGTRAPC
eukprot:1777891-Pyramimonas_sp.AAC.1